MATVNFSVPERVKRLFNKTFSDDNKSAIIADLMVQAIEQRATLKSRAEAADRLLARRAHKKPVTEQELRAARLAGRP